jgi:hypothetical protein
MTCNPAFHKYDSNFIQQANACQNTHAQLAAYMDSNLGDPGDLKNPCREDRFHRYGVRDYSIMVFQEGEEDAARYVIRASSSVDARCMAFLLDGGCEPGLTHFDAGYVELALAWTEVIE